MVGSLFFAGMFICLVHSSSSQTADDVKNLRQSIFVFGGYDKKVRPTKNQTLPTVIHVQLTLLSIDYLEEVTETMKTTGYLQMVWLDEFLAWEPGRYGGVQYAYFAQDDIWKPDIALINSYNEYEELGAPSLRAMVTSYGAVAWLPFQVFRSTCSFDITYFPFDVQSCSLKFVVWSYPKAEVYLYSSDSGIQLAHYKPSSSWKLTNTSWEVNLNDLEAAITFTLTLKRKPLHFILNVYVPIILLSVLNLFVFVLPCESGERSGYAITVFLSFAVFLTIVSTALPVNSDSVAIFALFILVQTIQSTFITLVALLQLRMNSFQDNRPVPKCVLHLARLAMLDLNNKRGPVTPVVSEDRRAAVISVEMHRQKSEPSDELEQCDDTCIQDVSNEPKDTWKYVVRGLDKFCFVLCLSVLFLNTSLCVIIAATASA